MPALTDKVTAKVKRSFSYTFNYHPGDEFEAQAFIIIEQALAGHLFLPDELKSLVERPANEVIKEELEEKIGKKHEKHEEKDEKELKSGKK